MKKKRKAPTKKEKIELENYYEKEFKTLRAVEEEKEDLLDR